MKTVYVKSSGTVFRKIPEDGRQLRVSLCPDFPAIECTDTYKIPESASNLLYPHHDEISKDEFDNAFSAALAMIIEKKGRE